VSDDFIREQYAKAREVVQARLDELDGEIVRTAAPYLHDARHGRLDKLQGAGRRYITDRVIEKLCLEAVLSAHETALADALEHERRRLEHEAREVTPMLAEEAKRLQRMRAESDELARVEMAKGRVRDSQRRTCRKPDDEDIKLLRKHRSWSGVEQLLWDYDREPWWTQQDNRSK
jgi:hypothetical protein